MTADAECVSHTPGPWRITVVVASVGLEETHYAHQVIIGRHAHTVAHHSHQNYDRIERKNIGGGNVEETGVGRRKPDLTAHPDARLIAAAPDMLAALRAGVEEAWRQDLGNSTEFNQDIIHAMEAAIAKAEGRDV